MFSVFSVRQRSPNSIPYPYYPLTPGHLGLSETREHPQIARVMRESQCHKPTVWKVMVLGMVFLFGLPHRSVSMMVNDVFFQKCQTNGPCECSFHASSVQDPLFHFSGWLKRGFSGINVIDHDMS